MRIPRREKRKQRGSEWSKKIEYNFPVLKVCISVLKESTKCRAQMNEKRPTLGYSIVKFQNTR